MTFALLVICKYDGKRLCKLTSLSGTVGKTSTNAHRPPKMVRIMMTSGSPRQSTLIRFWIDAVLNTYVLPVVNWLKTRWDFLVELGKQRWKVFEYHHRSVLRSVCRKELYRWYLVGQWHPAVFDDRNIEFEFYVQRFDCWMTMTCQEGEQF